MIFCYRNFIAMVYVVILSDGLKATCTIEISLSKLVTLYLVVRPLFVVYLKGQLWGHCYFCFILMTYQTVQANLSFRIFADDTNMFYTSNNLRNLESVMNKEFKLVVKYSATNKLSINLSKTNYILVSSSRLSGSINVNDIKIQSQIKYLGVYIDQHLHWGPQIKHINSKLAKNIGIVTKLRHYVNLHTLKQLYYSFIYPYLTYAITSWGSACTTRLNKIRTKQNKCICSIFLHIVERMPRLTTTYWIS